MLLTRQIQPRAGPQHARGQKGYYDQRSCCRVRYSSILSARVAAVKGHEPTEGEVQADLEDALARHTRRQALLASAAATGLSMLGSAGPVLADAIDTTITSQIYLDIGIASTALKPQEERTLGSKTSIPEDAQPIGRIVLGLYGNHVPVTVRNLTTLVEAGLLNGTVFSRVLAGEYIQAGKQGSRRMGELQLGAGVTLEPNPELSAASAFRLPHFSPGTLSLSLSENDEEEPVRERPGYKPTEFLITTGPGPVPRLDGQNIVFGKVVEGLDVVRAVATVPTFQPSERANAMNRLAAAIGDDRANAVRRKYGKPLKAVVILGSGVMLADAGAAAAAL